MKRVLNLAPASIRRRQTLRRLSYAVSTAVTIAGITGATWLLIEWGRGAAMAQNLGRLEAEYAPLARLINEQTHLREQIAKLQAREQLSLRLTTAHAGVPILSSVAQAAAAADGGVYVEDLRYQTQRAQPGRRGGRPAATQRPVVHIEGASRDGLAVARFAEGLRDSGIYAQVSIESSRPASSASGAAREFEINCAF
ncbi:MAG: PilN domain-containing protein [Planctomycetota bacterium]